MNRAILHGTPLRLTLEETRNHVKTALALYELARTGASGKGVVLTRENPKII